MRHASWIFGSLGVIALASCLLDRTGQGTFLTDTMAGGSGGTPLCNAPPDCPQETCKVANCVSGECFYTLSIQGVPCGNSNLLTCSVEGECKAPVGTACGGEDECHSGYCPDAVCCIESCQGPCASCDNAAGECVGAPSGTDPENDCSSGDVVCDGSKRCATGDHQWSVAMGATQDLENPVITASPDGRAYVGFQYRGMLDLGALNYDRPGNEAAAIFAKLNTDGSVQWSHELTGGAEVRITGIRVFGNIVYLSCFFDDDLMLDNVSVFPGGGGTHSAVLQFNASGQRLPPEVLISSAAEARVRSLAVGATGEVIVGGEFRNDIAIAGQNFNAADGRDQGWFATFDADLNLKAPSWYISSGNLRVGAVLIQPNDTTRVAGRFTMNFDPAVVTATADGIDAFLVGYDAVAVLEYAHTFSAPDYQEVTALANTRNNGLAIAGAYQGAANLGGLPLTDVGNTNFGIFIASFDSAGTHLWSGGSSRNTDVETPVAFDSDRASNLILGSSFVASIELGTMMLTTSSGTQDGFIAKFTPQGSLLWSRLATGDASETVHSVASALDGSVFAAGTFDGTDVDVGGGALPGVMTQQRIFFAKYAP